MTRKMGTPPKFTERATHEIRRLIAKYASDLPEGKYMPCVGWEIGFDKNFRARPAMGLHEVAIVPDSLIVECHGMKVAYNIPDDVMATLHSSLLDFDGKEFVFVDSGDAGVL
jgi:hypothetical protein